ncbi:hypothetical protein CDD82_3822 [Ophiocordyceps australis]|uniref:DNA-directed RNA polymerase I subunit RPA49 n=1 Tax=Ophiocordyceps australis TaxID=1399860 RepID=A0A2C5Z069_9HYPO|nr:hypothetical protein CDD82_3822 [Ophiocordyceps australis]
MSTASDMKRKRNEESVGNAKKRVALEVPPSTVSVKSVLHPLSCPPVIVSSPGLEVPQNLTFHPHVVRQAEPPSKSKSKSIKDVGSREMELRSTGHPSIDYIAQEEEPAENRRLKHYLGIYDPKTGELEIIEAKKMIVRGEVRARRVSVTPAVQEQPTKQNTADSRSELVELFGTKKAKKMVSDRKINAITPSTPSAPSAKREQADIALLSSVGAATSAMATREELQAAVTEAKPIPRANLEASTIERVYAPEDIIGRDILDQLPIRRWQEKGARGEGIETISRFVAMRVNALATDASAVDRLRVLRYLEFTIRMFRSAKETRTTYKLPSTEKLRELLFPVPEPVLHSIRHHFSEKGVMRKYHVDKLKAYCAVFACIVDNFEVDIHDLQEDLLMQSLSMKQYFSEIGAKVKQISCPTTKKKINMAKLELPLEFPKQRRIARRR